MGRGLALLEMGSSPGAADKTGVVSKAVDDLIASLSEHLEEGDNVSARRTLGGIARSFEVLGDGKQAVGAAMKLARLCERNDDAAGAADAKAWETRLRTQFGVKDE